ncbi:MAG: SDR family NAD(P)-dependent oxidoreductase, partial [Planctomycetota bacterium]
MRVLVTGGAGFIGSHLADRLLSDGHDVAVVDDLSTGHREFVPEDAAFFEADIRDAAALERVFAEFRPDAVSHQAAHASVGRSVREPAYDADVNVLGTIRVVEACRRHAVSRLVFASSGGAIYGEADRPVPEDSPLLPKSPYGMSKLAGEHYVRFFAEEGGGTAVVLRYANVFGPRQDSGGEGGVISIFGERMLAAAPSTIFGEG